VQPLWQSSAAYRGLTGLNSCPAVLFLQDLGVVKSLLLVPRKVEETHVAYYVLVPTATGYFGDLSGPETS